MVATLAELKPAKRNKQRTIYRGSHVMVCPYCGQGLRVVQITGGELRTSGMFLPDRTWYETECCRTWQGWSPVELKTAIDDTAKRLRGKTVWV